MKNVGLFYALFDSFTSKLFLALYTSVSMWLRRLPNKKRIPASGVQIRQNKSVELCYEDPMCMKKMLKVAVRFIHQ